MKLAALDRLRCPACVVGLLSLQSRKATEGEVLEGQLSCRTCRATYDVTDGVPRFVDTENYSASFGLQWLSHRQTQLDSFTGAAISRTRLFAVSGWPRDMGGESVLEAGSGAGRFTEVLASSGATVYSFDYSRAVDANWLNNGLRPGVHLFQGDLFAIPVEKQSFDRVLCLGVLQHTPDPARAFRELAACVRPGGELVIDVYTKRFVSLLQWKYLLRPLTKRMDPHRLYRLVRKVVPRLVPLTADLRRVGGRVGARLSPIAECSHLGLSPELTREWAVLDTFDMYAPAFDRPQSLVTVRRWFNGAGFETVSVTYGPNGVVGRGRRPTPAGSKPGSATVDRARSAEREMSRVPLDHVP